MIANYHTHTKRCLHASGEDREYVEAAIKAGFDTLGFADHRPWHFENDYVSPIRMPLSQLDDYFKSLSDLKNEYKNDIKIYIGFESEYIPEYFENQQKYIDGYPLDYMILGQHFTEPEDLSKRFTAWLNTDEDYLSKYVDTVIEGMKTGRFLYLAHPDVFYYNGAKSVYKKHMTRLCEFLSENNIPVEINQLGLSENRHYPCDSFFRIAQKCGCSAIIGADAHSPQMLSDMEAREECVKFAEKYSLKLADSPEI